VPAIDYAEYATLGRAPDASILAQISSVGENYLLLFLFFFFTTCSQESTK
jgi:hypothetical protein